MMCIVYNKLQRTLWYTQIGGRLEAWYGPDPKDLDTTTLQTGRSVINGLGPWWSRNIFVKGDLAKLHTFLGPRTFTDLFLLH